MRVRFAAINPIDWKMRSGDMKIVTGSRFPRTMGMDLSGTVMAVGPGVTRFKVGDEVFGQARFKQCGALGEAAIAAEEALALKPAGVLLDLHPAPLKFLRALFNRILAGSATAAEVAPWRRLHQLPRRITTPAGARRSDGR